MNFTITIIIFITAYLLGSINSALVVGKFYGNIDVRKHGSGNAGANNVLRVMGAKAALLVLLGDMLKGALAVVIAYIIAGGAERAALYTQLAGLGVVIGHNWPIFYEFKGGKGVVTSAAVVFMMNWKLVLISLVFGIVIIALTRYVSLASITGSILFAVLALFYDRKTLLFAVLLAALIIFRHRANIQRLFSGTESRLGQGSSSAGK